MGKNLAVILAGGSGNRFGNNKAKQFLKLAGKAVIVHTLGIFSNHKDIDEIFIVTNPLYYEDTQNIVGENGFNKVTKILKGGKTRQDSSRIAIETAKVEEIENVIIHDAVRPFIRNEIISSMIETLKSYKAVDVVIDTSDTIVEIDENKVIKSIPKRRLLKRGQTPQGFKLDLLKKAHNMAIKDKWLTATDDCGLILKYNLADIKVIDGDELNIKITYPLDIHIADKIFQIKQRNSSKNSKNNSLKGKNWLIFGGNRGIGKEIALKAESLGAKVFVYSQSLGTDIRDYNSCKKAIKESRKFAKIDAVIITAGILSYGTLENQNEKIINEQIDINFKGSINVSKASINVLKESKGDLLFFASSSYTRGRENYSIYSSTKAGIVNFAQALADELSPYGVRVNVINPERTNTDMRRENFGIEDPKTLLDPKDVALKTINFLEEKLNGVVLNINRDS